MKLDNLINQQRKTNKSKWIIFKSKKLNTNIVLLIDKKYLKEARSMHPGLVVYFPQEVEELWNCWISENKNNDEIINIVHTIKKEFNAWLLPYEENQ